MTKAQLEHSRGMDVINQLKIVQNMINADSLEIGKSIQPVLTKCDPTDSKLDIEVTRYNLDQQLQNHINILEAQASHQLNSQSNSYETNEEKQEDMRLNDDYFKNLREFFQAFTYNL